MEDTRIRFIPLFVEIKSKACKDEGKERHEDSDSNRTAVGGAVGFRVSESNILSHTQTWKKNIIFSKIMWETVNIQNMWMKSISNIQINTMAQTLEKLNGIIERYVSSAGDDDGDDDDNEEVDDHNDDKSETQQPVDKGDNHNDRTDNDHCDCDNLVEDNHELMATGRLSTKK